jgi:hypothetical protein
MDRGITNHQIAPRQDFGGARGEVLAKIRRWNLPRLGAAFMRTVADQFADILVAAGVKRIYGIVGDSDGRWSVVIITDAGVRP